MKLLICTQVVDERDPVLGFFTKWIAEIAKHCEHVEVICLSRGTHSLPANVAVHSLGKSAQDEIASGFQKLWLRISYSIRFYRYVWKVRDEYDAVFVHQNQEYVLLGGLVWKLLRKPVYLWRNHYKGSLLTRLAVAFSRKVFCTSEYSFTAKYAKTVLMPVGVDTSIFKALQNSTRTPCSILCLGRIAPSKNLDVILEGLGKLRSDGKQFSAVLYGDALRKDSTYLEHLKHRIEVLDLQRSVLLRSGVPNDHTPEIYNSSELFVNASRSGMLDKTIFEAAACGCTVIASSRDFAQLAGDEFSFREGDALDCAGKIAMHLGKVAPPRLREIAKNNSLEVLVQKLLSVFVNRV